MLKHHKYVVGKCMTKCPEKELAMREKERLLHSLEVVRGTERHRRPKADRCRAVKEFSRSAAGKIIDENDVRPPEILLETIRYLLFDVITMRYAPWNVIYDFVTDRLRAVRQDMVVQNLLHSDTIRILEPIVRFHCYASYRLCKETWSNFDPVLNNKHIQECLKRLLQAYDHSEGPQPHREEFEAIYIVFNLGHDEPLARFLTLEQSLSNRNGLLHRMFKMSLAYRSNNYIRVCRTIRTLSDLLAPLAAMHLLEVRRRAFKIMSSAYHSKLLAYPIDGLRRSLLYDTYGDVLDDCRHFGLSADLKTGVQFQKADFNDNQDPREYTHYRFVDDKIDSLSIPNLILSGVGSDPDYCDNCER